MTTGFPYRGRNTVLHRLREKQAGMCGIARKAETYCRFQKKSAANKIKLLTSRLLASRLFRSSGFLSSRFFCAAFSL